MFNKETIFMFFPIIGAICGAMLWLKYFIKIDVLERERLIDIIFALVIGFLTPNLALWAYKLHASYAWDFNGYFLTDLWYAIAGIGFTEEISKLFGVLLVFLVIRKRLNEPIDYLIFGGIVALGFSVKENFIYYHNYGSEIITGRTLISTLTHIINTSICVYGIFRFKIFNKGYVILNSISGISIAIISHGLFDFFLTQEFIGSFTPFLASIVYLIGINFWIQMINNCINFSPFFNYEKLISTSKLYFTILGWYIGLLLIEFFYVWYHKKLDIAILDLFKNIFKEGILLIIVALRVSRLKISKRKYFIIKPQFPIYYTKNNDEDINLFGVLPLKVRGENEKEFRLFKYMGKDLVFVPVNPNKSSIQNKRKGRLLKKYFLKNDVVSYLIEFYEDDTHPKEVFILKPKTRGTTFFQGEFPIVTIAKYNLTSLAANYNLPSYKDFNFIENVYIKTV